MDEWLVKTIFKGIQEGDYSNTKPVVLPKKNRPRYLEEHDDVIKLIKEGVVILEP